METYDYSILTKCCVFMFLSHFIGKIIAGDYYGLQNYGR